MKKLFVITLAFLSIVACKKKEEPFVIPDEPYVEEVIPEDSVFYEMDLRWIDLLGHTEDRISGKNFYEYKEEERERKIINALRHLRVKRPELGYAYFVVKSNNFTNESYRKGNALSNLSMIAKRDNYTRFPINGEQPPGYYGDISSLVRTYEYFRTPFRHWVRDAYLYRYIIEAKVLYVLWENYGNREDIRTLDILEENRYVTKEERIKIEEFLRKKYPEKAEDILSIKTFYVSL